MKKIIQRLARFAKDKKEKKTKKKDKKEKAVEEDSENSEDTKEQQEEKPPIDVKALLSGMADEMESRTMLLQGSVDEEKAGEIISGFLALADLKPPRQDLKKGEMPYDPIKMYISTYGGSADEMFAIYDIMTWCKEHCDIQTIGLGKVMSAGTLILAAGTKGKRSITAHCRVMMHSVNGGHAGELHNLQNEMEQMAGLQDSYIQAMSNETNMTKRQLQTLINKKINIYLDAEEAIGKGLADEVWNG